jgi:hypothetical protein
VHERLENLKPLFFLRTPSIEAAYTGEPYHILIDKNKSSVWHTRSIDTKVFLQINKNSK